MNFNLYLDDQTAEELDRTAKKLGETRNGLIRKALREWLDKKTLGSPGWPRLILEWQRIPDFLPFESYRGARSAAEAASDSFIAAAAHPDVDAE